MGVETRIAYTVTAFAIAAAVVINLISVLWRW